MTNATNRWLDKLAAADKAKGGTGTDYKLAQILELPPQRISRYRRGADKTMGDDTAIKLAELLGVHPMIVVADIRAEQARDARAARVWDQVAKAAKGGKIAALSGAAILTAQIGPSLSEAASQLCILCKVAPANDPRAPRRSPRQIPGRIVPLSNLTAFRPAHAVQ